MTEFEQQVAEILTPVFAAFGAKGPNHDHEVGSSDAGWFGYPCICSPKELAEALAPRVAAAITAAGKVAIRTAEDGDRARDAALAALRGET